MGYNGQKASFTRGTITVKQVGHGKYHLRDFNEDCQYLRFSGIQVFFPAILTV